MKGRAVRFLGQKGSEGHGFLARRYLVEDALAIDRPHHAREQDTWLALASTRLPCARLEHHAGVFLQQDDTRTSLQVRILGHESVAASPTAWAPRTRGWRLQAQSDEVHTTSSASLSLAFSG